MLKRTRPRHMTKGVLRVVLVQRTTADCYVTLTQSHLGCAVLSGTGTTLVSVRYMGIGYAPKI